MQIKAFSSSKSAPGWCDKQVLICTFLPVKHLPVRGNKEFICVSTCYMFEESLLCFCI